MSYSIAQLNQLDQDTFTAALGDIFEHTPTIARTVWLQRPFTDLAALHQAMATVVMALSVEDQLALIRAHPDLGSRTKMADASLQEQAGAGLDRLTPDEYQQFQTLNQAYNDKFAFPFIIAVKQHTKASILAAFSQRLNNSIASEQEQALQEIVTIARFRLLDRIRESESSAI